MGIDEKTLRKYFSRELELGAVLIEGVVLDVLLRRTREGHAPSVRQLREVSIEGKRRVAERDMGSDERPVQNDRPGKKVMDAQRAAAADEDLMAELEMEAAQNATH